MVKIFVFIATLAFAQILLSIEPRADTCDDYLKQWDKNAESFNGRCVANLTKACLLEEAANILFYKNLLSTCTGRLSAQEYQAALDNIRKNEKDLERYGESGPGRR